MKILNELSQFGLIISIIYLIFVIGNFMFKFYGRFKLGNDTKLDIGNWGKSLLLISITYILTYLF